MSRYRLCTACRRRVRSEDPADRVCGGCGERRPASAFPNSSNPSAWCRGCGRENARRWRERNPTQPNRWRETPQGRRATARTKIRVKYGLSGDDFDALILASEGRCEACSTATPDLVIDHCHATGVVRGVLCPTCNTGIGMLGDTAEAVASALAYLLVAEQGGVFTGHL